MTEPKEPTHQDWAKRFAVACGNEWHENISDQSSFLKFFRCSCGEKNFTCIDNLLIHIKESNSSFLNPQDILDECMKWDDYAEFIKTVGAIMTPHNYHEVIRIDLITERPPTRFLKEATLFREERDDKRRTSTDI